MSVTPPPDAYNHERLATCLEGVAQEEMREGFQGVDRRLDTINVRLHNIEARAKNEDAYERRVNYIPLLKTDGAEIANFPFNADTVDGLNTQTINALLTDLGLDFQGRTLAKKKVLLLREIGVKTTHNG
ncbi:hypothetical protein F53441_344 [Fusarium austroafricanum]|uniref:Uncharacterized protein n=1 Tax=Fusarium austroafricanum TaxID=2364996 RepID=A0A8H4PEQ9_9HYPO|nr:hypothetical protein F53441_344 [Fusarium austroafricanum]